jgi:DNA helicase-2/ATP-dependent DNA helicase PcrA
MTLELTSQQKAAIASATQPTSFALEACAGTGKSFTLQQTALALKGTGIATSFSKSTTDELAKRMPQGKFIAKSMHAIGLAAIRDSGKFTNPVVPDKVRTLVTELVKADEEPDYSLISPISQLVSLAKTYGITPTESALLPDELASWQWLADAYDIDPFNPFVLDLAREALARSTKIALEDGQVDFDDLLYISLLYPHRFPRYPTIIVDEAQDLNTLQHLMVARILRPSGRVIAAGDRSQAIFGFRGALHDSYDQLINRFSMQRLPLTVSFRCPRAVVREAKRFVPEIESAPLAPEGAVLKHNSLSIYDVPHTVICRNNAPLVNLALKLLVAGRSAEVAGREIGQGLISLTKHITKKNLKRDEFISRLLQWAEREKERRPRARGNINDKAAALRALAEAHSDLDGVQQHLLKLYPNPKDKNYRPAEVRLSTIHKAKGLEFPEVLFLDPQLLPSKYAEQDWELTQENNLAYVGITRAQQVLHYATLESIE